MEKGLTLFEVLLVVVIVGILAGFVYISHGRFLEKQTGLEGQTNLELIYHAQKRYSMSHRGAYFFCPGACSKEMIRAGLGINLSGFAFSYSINADSQAGFLATAQRIGKSRCTGKTMSLGGNSGEVEKGCVDW